MANTKLSMQDFAAKIKAKYPQYKNIDDETLTQKVLAKYPTYQGKVDYTPPSPLESNLEGGMRDFGLGAAVDTAHANPALQAIGPVGGIASEATKDPKQALMDALGAAGWASGAGEEAAGAKIASTIPGAVGKILGYTVPKAVSGAIQGASQSTNPGDIATSAGLNTALPLVGKLVGKSQLLASLGKEGPALPAIQKEVGQTAVGGYKQIAQKMGEFQGKINGKIEKIYEQATGRGGGLSRGEIANVLNSVFTGTFANEKGKYAYLKSDPAVQDFINNRVPQLVKDLGENVFSDREAQGKYANPVVDDTMRQAPVKPGETNPMDGQVVKKPFPKGTREVVKKGDSGANRVGPSNTFTTGSFKNEKGQFAAKGNPTINEPSTVGTGATHALPNGVAQPAVSRDYVRDWINASHFSQGQYAKSWGTSDTKLPLAIADRVGDTLSTIGNDAFKASQRGEKGASSLAEFGKAAYGQMQEAIRSKSAGMSPQEALQHVNLRGLNNKAQTIKTHANHIVNGKIFNNASKLISGGEIGGAVLGTLGHVMSPLLGPVGSGLAGAYTLTRPSVATAMNSPIGKGIASNLSRVATSQQPVTSGIQSILQNFGL